MSLHKNIIKLWSFLEKKRRIQFFLLIILICLCAFVEMVSIGLVVPFIAILADPKILYSFDIYNLLVKFLHLNNLDNIRIVLFIFFFSWNSLIRFFEIFLMYFNAKYSYLVGADICKAVYKKTLNQPYEEHIQRNSSDYVASIFGKCSMLIGSILNPLLLILSSVVLIVSISSIILLLDIITTLSISMILIILYSFLFQIF